MDSTDRDNEFVILPNYTPSIQTTNDLLTKIPWNHFYSEVPPPDLELVKFVGCTKDHVESYIFSRSYKTIVSEADKKSSRRGCTSSDSLSVNTYFTGNRISLYIHKLFVQGLENEKACVGLVIPEVMTFMTDKTGKFVDKKMIETVSNRFYHLYQPEWLKCHVTDFVHLFNVYNVCVQFRDYESANVENEIPAYAPWKKDQQGCQGIAEQFRRYTIIGHCYNQIRYDPETNICSVRISW